MTGFKPLCANKCINTTSVQVNFTPDESKKGSKHSAKKPKAHKQRHISTQTMVDDQALCLRPMQATSLAPYLKFRHSPSNSSDPEVYEEEEVESDNKVEWLFHSTDTCARTHAMRAQVRLLRVLKQNLEKYNPTDNRKLKLCEGVIPDEIGWEALGPELQSAFIRLYKLMHLLELLPTDDALKTCSVRVVETLKHLLSHLPFPQSLTHTIDISVIHQPRTDAMASYLFGWKLKEIINLLRFVYRSKLSLILPTYFKAEVIQADRLVYDSLVFAVQGMRNTAIPHNAILNANNDFLACSEVPSFYSPSDDIISSAASSDLSDIEDLPTEPNQSTASEDPISISPTEDPISIPPSEDPISIPPSEDPIGIPPSPSNDVSEKEIEALEELAAKSNPSNVLKGLSMTQLVSMAGIVQSRIEKIKKKQPAPPPSEPTPAEPNIDVTEPTGPPPLISNALQLYMSQASSRSSSASHSQASLSRTLASSSRTSKSATGPPVHGRILPKPVTQFTDISKIVSASSQSADLRPPVVTDSDRIPLAEKVTITAKGLLSSVMGGGQSESDLNCARASMTSAKVLQMKRLKNLAKSKLSSKTLRPPTSSAPSKQSYPKMLVLMNVSSPLGPLRAKPLSSSAQCSSAMQMDSQAPVQAPSQVTNAKPQPPGPASGAAAVPMVLQAIPSATVKVPSFNKSMLTTPLTAGGDSLPSSLAAVQANSEKAQTNMIYLRDTLSQKINALKHPNEESSRMVINSWLRRQAPKIVSRTNSGSPVIASPSAGAVIKTPQASTPVLAVPLSPALLASVVSPTPATAATPSNTVAKETTPDGAYQRADVKPTTDKVIIGQTYN